MGQPAPAPAPASPLLAAFADRCRVTAGAAFVLDDHASDAMPEGLDRPAAAAMMAAGIATLSDMQARLHARATSALLIVFQGMDAAGKDGTIKHVLSGVNPQGVTVTAFDRPGPEDLAHDFLWRPARALPARGMIGVFNRSHYEDVLVPRVHPEALARQHLPRGIAADGAFWRGRLDDITAFERHLVREGTAVVKFYLNVGREEQGRRLRARLNDPGKLWKFDPQDLVERRRWADYRAAYQEAIAATAAPEAPWFIIPADRKWFMRLVVLTVINQAMAALDLERPRPSEAVLDTLAEARRELGANPSPDHGDGA